MKFARVMYVIDALVLVTFLILRLTGVLVPISEPIVDWVVILLLGVGLVIIPLASMRRICWWD